jgi:hypothetical protein
VTGISMWVTPEFGERVDDGVVTTPRAAKTARQG